MVIKGIDRDRWVAVSKNAVPLKDGTAIAAELIGVCVLTETLDLVFNKCQCMQKINQSRGDVEQKSRRKGRV